MAADLPPLTLYVHLPWCVHKCPYCDFNSHAVHGKMPESSYVDALLADLRQDMALAGDRPLQAIFLGGGTPSLFSAHALEKLLDGVARACHCAEDMEITLEANPGTVEAGNFRGYRSAGVNRLSLGIQSFNDTALQKLGRIHDREQALAAIGTARAAGFDNLNLDLMYALPGQTRDAAADDVATAIHTNPEHISCYQLTLEPGTAFFHWPPPLPDDDEAWSIQCAVQSSLREHGYRQYEVSAYARNGRPCRHNLNYWRFGDYLGIGAGAHGKLTGPDGRVRRSAKLRMPRAYMAAAAGPERLAETYTVPARDLPLEFTMNALRLCEGFSIERFEARTGLSESVLSETISDLEERGLISRTGRHITTSELGWQHLNDVMLAFLPDEAPA